MPIDPLGLRRLSPIPHPSRPAPLFPEQFKVQITVAHRTGVFYGDVKVMRRSDGRKLYPFDGAPTLGPFDGKEAARDAAISAARKVIADDIANPEP